MRPGAGLPARCCSSSTTSIKRPSGCAAWASRSWPVPSTGRGGTVPSTSATPTGSWSNWPRRSRARSPARAEVAGRPDGGIGAVLAYHDSTKHSPVSIRSRAHFLDWANKPHPLKAHAGLERVPLPDNVPSLADPALHALTRLRAGDHRGHLVRAAGSEAFIARAPVVLVLTGIPWRTGWKYTERGYRHLFWDAGMILARSEERR